MSAAILDRKRTHRYLRHGWTTGAGVGPKYRDCNLDDSYAESFRAGYALGASRLQSCLYRRPHRTITLLRLEGKLYRGPFLPFPKHELECVGRSGGSVGFLQPNATSLHNDSVIETEQHYWVHVAIDRFTGQVIDKQIEVVNE
jgi:hypothetical protein